MKKSISLASTLALSGMLSLSAVVSAQEKPAAAAAPESVPLSGGAASAAQVIPGFYWCRVQQAYRVIGATYTWAYLENCQGSTNPVGWCGCNDNECEKTFIAAAASANWVGINFNTSNTFDSVRLYKY